MKNMVLLFLVGAMFCACSVVQAAASVSAKSATIPKEQKAIVHGRKSSGERIIAKFKLAKKQTKFNSSFHKDVLTKLGSSIIREYKHIPGIVVLGQNNQAKVSSEMTESERGIALEKRIKELMASGLFEFAEPDWVVHTLATPSDDAFADGRLWGLRNYGQSGGSAGADIGAISAWDITTGDTNVIVGIVDTGIRYTHQDLAANMWRNPGEIAGNGIDDDSNGYIDDVYGINAITGSGNPMDDNSHGSHCAGTIGAVANGGGPHVGVAWNVRLMGLKFLSADGSGYSSDAVECVDYAISKSVDILSNSWGGGGYSSAMKSAIQRANAAGIIFIAAAGNEANNNDSSPSYPASYNVDNVISVAALDRSDNLASFSNYGVQSVDLGAPGVAIYSCTADSDISYDIYNGTSMATPHVSGVAALIAAQFPGITVSDLKQRLLLTTVSVPSLAGKSLTGGRVNAAAALDAAPDNIMEVYVRAENNPLIANELNSIYVQVSDLTPVLGAVVVGALEGQASNIFFDNGIAPDATFNDGIYSASLSVPDITGSIDLVVAVTAAGKTPATVTNSFAVVGKPANDDFDNRITVPGGATLLNGVNLNATLESGEPRYYYGAGSSTVWWQWTATETVPVTISTLGSDFDTILSIYTGKSLGALTHIGSNDDSGGYQSSVSFSAQSGVSYVIQVNGYGSEVGSIQLNVPAPAGAPAIIDEPDDVSVLVGNSFSLLVTASGQSPFTYQWYLDDIPILGATTTTYSIASSSLDDEGHYHVTVSNAVGVTTSRKAFVAVEQVELTPDNDSFASAWTLDGSSGRITSDNTLATGETGEPNHGEASLPLASIWFKWTAPSNGILSVNTFGSNFDTILAAYQGNVVNSLRLIVDNDDTGSLQSEIKFSVIGGVTYNIAVDGYFSSVGSVTLDYNLIYSNLAVKNDFDGDGLSDMGVYYPPLGKWYMFTSTDEFYEDQFGYNGTKPITGDFDGDGKSDFGVYYAPLGKWYIFSSTDGFYENEFGYAETIPITGDFDGDGKCDFGCYHPPSGNWYLFQTTNGFYQTQFGFDGTIPVTGDFDGDGKCDYGYYHPATGAWKLSKSTGGFKETVFGFANTVPIVGDFDADGTDDFGVYYDQTGAWYIFRSTDGFFEEEFGYAGTVPVVGDYDGDGQADIGCYYAPGGNWYIIGSTTGFYQEQFGYSGTIPLGGTQTQP